MKVHRLDIAASLLTAIKTACVVALLAATGCTTLYEGKYDFSEGWREAQVIRIAKASQYSQMQIRSLHYCLMNTLGVPASESFSHHKILTSMLVNSCT